MAAPKKPKTHLLIDGDIAAFISAAAAQDVLIDDTGWAQPRAHTIKAEVIIENLLWSWRMGLNADTFEVILTDDHDNWRRSVDDSYKRNRTGERPLLLDYMKQYLRDVHGAYHWDGLEADDVLSVKMTQHYAYRCEVCQEKGLCKVCELPGEPNPRLICVGRDKDFKTIPGLHHCHKQDVDIKGKMLVREVTQWEADRFFMIQALAGDAVDGFKGCAGIGMKRAAEIIDTPVRLVPKEGVITRGVNKGQAVMKWMAEPTSDYWACIVSHYRKAGMTEDDALVTARLARLLRYKEDYDPETQELTLWTPELLRGVGK